MGEMTRRDLLWIAGAAARSSDAAQSRQTVSESSMRSGASLARRKEALDMLLKLLDPTKKPSSGRLNSVDATWEDWLKRTGELPPDFQDMPSCAELPDPLVLVENGRKIPIKTHAQWRLKRQWIRSQMEYWITGKIPPPPGNLRGKVQATRREGDVTVQDVLLEFGPDHKGTLHLQLLIPPGKGPFPVLVTNHSRRRPWVNTAVRRGYIGCIVFAVDATTTVPDDSDKWIELYPDYDFGCLARWAFGMMRALDYLWPLPIVDQKGIAVSGHSRNAKAVVIAAAFDERFSAVIPSRSNTGDGDPWRFTTEMFLNESMEDITRENPHWYHPRLRFFVGREHKLPVDSNLMMSLVAPRALLMSHAFTEHQGGAVGTEQNYRSVRSVYRFLGHEEKFGLYQQPGEHPSSVEDVEQYFDFLDMAFGRKRFPKPEIWVHGYRFEDWQARSGESIDPLRYPVRKPGDFFVSRGAAIGSAMAWNERRTAIREQIRWALGEEPPGVTYYPQRRRLSEGGGTSTGWRGMLYPYLRPPAGVPALDFAFGDDLKGELYPPVGSPAEPPPPGTKWPVAIWLHPYSYAPGYSRYALWAHLARRGFAVLCFDQIGFGCRNQQTLRFHERYPKWSLLGKMVADTRAAVAALAALEDIDSSKIYLMGWALGAKVGLVTAALEEKVAGVGAACGFAPLRLDSPEKGTEGVWHYSHLHGLTPRLGFFRGHESRLPVDWDEILAAIAPRPVYLVAPTHDRYSPVADVRVAVSEARKAYRLLGEETDLELDTPMDFCRFLDSAAERRVHDWLAKKAGLPIPRPRPKA